jgi:hypothetical protein
VSVDTVLGQLLLFAILPNYQAAVTDQLKGVSSGLLIAVIIGAVFGTVVGALIAGALFGAIGAAISQAGPFRPRYTYDYD